MELKLVTTNLSTIYFSVSVLVGTKSDPALNVEEIMPSHGRREHKGKDKLSMIYMIV